MQENKQTTYLKDYKKLPYVVETVDLTFDLDDKSTHVIAKTQIQKSRDNSDEPLILNGENLKLLEVSIDGHKLDKNSYNIDDYHLTIKNLPDNFLLEIHTEISPIDNTALDGLYKSGGIFCTQNEPHGFRKITYFLDRPDVMGIYTTKIIADKKKYPILLSNGNEIEKGEEGEKHWVCWHDPFPKPCYLFALVAGDLGMISDKFITCFQREIDLRIYCDKGNESKCYHAMESLKKSMKWDEDVFGLEYDLDIFMIVAVDAFNFGAMENKGLNIFNTSCVLADDQTATDENFYRVEGVVAHEYFHNWTGNRVTCRDWFQLTLKEGLTVFRDQEFSADMHSRAVKRIEDVIRLRSAQFPEDAGPTSHPIKPKSYIEINNFYTATVYEKGAEVIRMVHTLLGEELFRKGIDKYFELYDGQAVTTEDFIHAMERASGIDLKEFSLWYHQSGTPEVFVNHRYDSEKSQVILQIRQVNLPTVDQKDKKPLFFPFKIGLIGSDGKDISFETEGCEFGGGSVTLVVSQEYQEYVLLEVKEKPILSLNRDFSAPIKLNVDYTKEELFFLMAYDSNTFCRWNAAQEVATELMLEMLNAYDLGEELSLDERYIECFGLILKDPTLDFSFKALALTIPSEDTLAQRQQIINFEGNHAVREFILSVLANRYFNEFLDLYDRLNIKEKYSFNSESVGRRSLKNACLKYLTLSKSQEAIELCYKQFHSADNMTDEFNALNFLANIECPEKDKALQSFYDKWKHDALVMCKWFSIQTYSKIPNALERAKKLLSDPAFKITIPNLVRALFNGFIDNHVQFHNPSGEGYSFIGKMILELDKINPYVSSRLAASFQKYGKLDLNRKQLLKMEITKILENKELSPNVYEILSKCLLAEIS